VHSAPDPRYSQPRFEAPSGPPVSGVVKWFSPEKGFGFVSLSDGSGDAFLHGSVLAQSGMAAIQPGETVEVRVGPGHKGPHVTEVLSIDSSTAVTTARRQSDFQTMTPSKGRPSSHRSLSKKFSGLGVSIMDGAPLSGGQLDVVQWLGLLATQVP
jgi:cold shock CspA family protein